MTVPSIKSGRDYGDQVEALEILLPQWFPELLPPDPDDPSSFRVGTVWPEDLYDVLPVVRLRDIGGNDDGLTDAALIDIDVLHFTYAQAKALARGIRARILGYPHHAGTTVLDKVRTAMRPHAVPWDDDRVARFYASYTVSARR